MSALDPTLGAGQLPPNATALEPAKVRNGSAAAKQAYVEALQFEQLLVDQLAKEMASTVSDSGSSESGSSNSGGLTGSSDPSVAAYADLIPTALTQSIMSSGGVGIAPRLVSSLDPSLANGGSSSGGHSSDQHPSGGVAP